jgi:CHAD domain-containing protein
MRHPQPVNHVELTDFLDCALDRAWRQFSRALRKTQSHCSERAVHDLRVTLRRLISMLQTFDQALRLDATRKPRRQLKKLLRLLSPVRDVHILCQYVNKLRSHHPGLKRLAKSLTRTERSMVRKAEKDLHHLESGDFKRMVGNARKVLRREFRRARSAQQLAKAFHGQVRARFAEVERSRSAVLPADTESIHALRIAFKKFRYAVEALQPDFVHVTAQRLHTMRKFQVRMGDIQDLTVVEEYLKKHARENPSSRRKLEPVQKEIVQTRRRRIAGLMPALERLSDFGALEAEAKEGKPTPQRQQK